MFSKVGPVGAKNISFDLEELVQKYQVKIKGLIHVGAHYGQEYEIYQKLGIANLDVQGYELEVLKGSQEMLANIFGILTEVNRDELYENCIQVEQLDDFLNLYDFQRVETNWEGETWGDAFYLKK